MANFSNKKLWVIIGVIALLVIGWVVWQLWPSHNPADDSDGLIPSVTGTFQPQMDEAKIKDAVKSALVQSLSGVDRIDVEVISVNFQEWPDACLGVKREDEVCAQVITPGYQVKALAASQIYEVRTDRDVEQVAIMDSNGEVIN